MQPWHISAFLGPIVAGILFGGSVWLVKRYLPAGRLKTILLDQRVGKYAAVVVYTGIAIWFFFGVMP